MQPRFQRLIFSHPSFARKWNRHAQLERETFSGWHLTLSIKKENEGRFFYFCRELKYPYP